MADSPLSPLGSSLLTFQQIPPSTYEYASGFSQESFQSKDFDVTLFINKCTAKITQMMDDDFNKTLHLIGDDIKEEQEDDKEDTDTDVSFPSKHLTASNLKQLHNDLSECYENIKQELINSFETNYPQFLKLNESLTAGTEHNLQKCQSSLDNVHKKYNAVYQQMLRLLERIHSKSSLKSNYISKLNTLKQISFVPNMIEDIKRSLKTLHSDFDPFHDYGPLPQTNKATESFKKSFANDISNAAQRRPYRLLQKSSRLERIAILLTKLTAIFAQKELNEHILVKNKETEFIALRNRFYNELKDVFLWSIRSGSLLSVRSNLRCYNYLNMVRPEAIVGAHYIKPLIYSSLPISIFKKEGNTDIINNSFDSLYTSLMDKLCILFNKELMINNDFIAESVWSELIDILLNEDYAESFISRGLPDLFHSHYSGVMSFFRKLQKLYYKEMMCSKKHINDDEYLYYHASSIRLRKKCNLSQYYLFRMPFITQNVMEMAKDKYSKIDYHFNVYLMYHSFKIGDKTENKEDFDEELINDYMKRLNTVKHAVSNSRTQFEYKYLLPIFQVCLLNLLFCWDSNRIWIWELSSNFLKLSVQILSFLAKYLATQMDDALCSSSLMVLIHSDLYYFCNWIESEFVPLIETQCVDLIANIEHKNNVKLLIHKSIDPSMDKIFGLRDDLLNSIIVNTILNECKSPLYFVDELADSWQANISNINNDDSEEIVQQKVSDYVSKLLKPLKDVLLFISKHNLSHFGIKEKNELIWAVLNGVANEYWNKIKKVQKKLDEIKKIMEGRRRRFKKNKNIRESGAERAEYQLFLDVRQFMQQIQGFVNGLQRDEKRMIDDDKAQKEEKEKEKKSSIIVIKKKIKHKKHETLYTTNNLQSWSHFAKFVDKFQ